MLKALLAGLVFASLVAVAASNSQAAKGGGTVCGPLVCSAKQVCCVSDPLPPAGPRYSCQPAGSTCNP